MSAPPLGEITMNTKLLVALSLVAVALAGCADEGTDPTPGTTGTPSTTPAGTTPAGTAPAASTPVTTTPVATSPVIPTNGTTNGTVNNTPPAPKVCPPSPTNETRGTRMGYPQLTYTVKEPANAADCFAFVGPETATAGWTAVTLQNNGRAPHIMPMFRIEGNHTQAEIKAALLAPENNTWAVPVGGVGFATPFSNGTVLIDLKPGTYVLACFIDGHHTQGMWRTLNVTAAPANATPAAAPVATLNVTMHDFGYNVTNFTAGTHVVAFKNNGTQPHEAPIVRLNANTTLQQFLAAIENPRGPPPGAGVGGVNMLAPGQTAYALVDFTAGNHGFVCFVTDPASHKPHVALGMAREFSVTAAMA